MRTWKISRWRLGGQSSCHPAQVLTPPGLISSYLIRSWKLTGHRVFYKDFYRIRNDTVKPRASLPTFLGAYGTVSRDPQSLVTSHKSLKSLFQRFCWSPWRTAQALNCHVVFQVKNLLEVVSSDAAWSKSAGVQGSRPFEPWGFWKLVLLYIGKTPCSTADMFGSTGFCSLWPTIEDSNISRMTGSSMVMKSSIRCWRLVVGQTTEQVFLAFDSLISHGSKPSKLPVCFSRWTRRTGLWSWACGAPRLWKPCGSRSRWFMLLEVVPGTRQGHWVLEFQVESSLCFFSIGESWWKEKWRKTVGSGALLFEPSPFCKSNAGSLFSSHPRNMAAGC